MQMDQTVEQERQANADEDDEDHAD